MASPLAQEKIWFDKYKYEEAERQYFEQLAKLLVNNGVSCTKIEPIFAPLPKPAPVSLPVQEVHVEIAPAATLPIVVPRKIPVSEPQQPRNEKLNKQKEGKEIKDRKNKADKKGRERKHREEIKGSPKNTPLKSTLAAEVAKARLHIKNSLECMDGIAALASSPNVEVVNKINSLEKENAELWKVVGELKGLVSKLDSRVKDLESRGSTATSNKAQPPKAAPAKKQDDDDDGVDLFGSDSESEDEDAKRVREQRLAEYTAKKSKKPVLIAKSNIILDVKPWDDETDMKIMEKEVRKITTDGLVWGASKLVPLAYGIKKLQISCVVEDDKVSVDWLQETIEELEDYVQSVDIAAFNKV